MGRRPVGEQAMTAAERQRRRRKKLARERQIAEESVIEKLSRKVFHLEEKIKRLRESPSEIRRLNRLLDQQELDIAMLRHGQGTIGDIMANALQGVKKNTIKKWFAELSLRHHPDRGGSHERMIALNDARDLLEKMIRESQQD